VAATTVLLLRASGPLQAWGVDSRFSMRDTGREPSKSGVIGLICAALGRPRDADIVDLAVLRIGVRADCEGGLLRDFHVAGTGGYFKASGDIERTNVIPGNRYYLQGARFLVGLEGDSELLRTIQAALADPVWPLFLGRKSCVPGEPFWLADGLRVDTTLEIALEGYPWLGPARIDSEKRPPELRVVLEDVAGELVRPDQPISFSERTFAPRRARQLHVPRPPLCLEEVERCTSPA
jgi:CRISPR system Cascade subunit CasD